MDRQDAILNRLLLPPKKLTPELEVCKIIFLSKGHVSFEEVTTPRTPNVSGAMLLSRRVSSEPWCAPVL